MNGEPGLMPVGAVVNSAAPGQRYTMLATIEDFAEIFSEGTIRARLRLRFVESGLEYFESSHAETQLVPLIDIFEIDLVFFYCGYWVSKKSNILYILKL